jgi:aspartoacylase
MVLPFACILGDAGSLGGEGMVGPRVLVVAGTHGNEVNAPWLLQQWERSSGLLESHGLDVVPVIGNPEAQRLGRRYVDRDLNRSFRPEWLEPDATTPQDQEIDRARALLHRYGPGGSESCVLALDLHSTTAAMGSSLVVYGRRLPDLALAAALQARLGLPIYLHEGDPAQQGFLVERWPCGLVIEIGPVPQMVLSARIIEQTQLVLQAALHLIAAAWNGRMLTPERLVVHRHLGSLDLPRDPQGRADALIHPELQGRDWSPLRRGDPLFLTAAGDTISYLGPEGVVPVFINEAAYAEKAIALSVTSKEEWPLSPKAPGALQDLLIRAQRGEPL